MAVTFKLRRGTAAKWTTNNPTLAAGEPGVETDTGKLKFGDGATAWNSLPYQAGSVYTQDSEPSAPADGAVWVDTNGATPSGGQITWTARQNPGTTANGVRINTIAYNGSDLYVAAGGDGTLYSSPDAITWTSQTSGFSTSTISKVAYGNGLWVAVGQSGKITTSTDGVTWTARTANMSTNYIYDVVYANSVWVAVGSGGGATNTGGITYSTDGITWTRKSQTPTIGTSYYAVIWNGTNWIVGADNSTNNYLYATTPSGSWTAAASGSNQAISLLFYDGTRTFSGSTGNGTFWYATGTTLSSSSQIENFLIPGVAYYYGGKIYAAQVFFQTALTTPITNNFVITSPLSFGPTGYLSNASPYFSSGNNVRAIYAGPAGIIIGDNMGGIYTSF